MLCRPLSPQKPTAPQVTYGEIEPLPRLRAWILLVAPSVLKTSSLSIIRMMLRLEQHQRPYWLFDNLSSSLYSQRVMTRANGTPWRSRRRDLGPVTLPVRKRMTSPENFEHRLIHGWRIRTKFEKGLMKRMLDGGNHAFGSRWGLWSWLALS